MLQYYLEGKSEMLIELSLNKIIITDHNPALIFLMKDGLRFGNVIKWIFKIMQTIIEQSKVTKNTMDRKNGNVLVMNFKKMIIYHRASLTLNEKISHLERGIHLALRPIGVIMF